MAKILLVEDELNIASFIERGLAEYGHEVDVVHDGQKGWDIIQEKPYDLLILDVIMPGMNGLELCSLYRKTHGYTTPVIMLTALGTTADIVKGLNAGADDYLPKPFSFQELEARINALLRRGDKKEAPMRLEYQGLSLDYIARKACREGIEVDLTVKEFRLLEYFMTHPGEVLSRQALLKHVWDKDFDTNTNVVDVYVNYLRTKVDKNFDVRLIHTVVGIGYVLDASCERQSL